MEEAVRVRVATAGEAERIMNLINAAFKRAESFIIDRDRVDLGQVEALLHKGTFLVAEEDGVISGCVYVELRGERAYLGLLSVDPERQKAGLGSILMTAAEKHSVQAGCRFMDLRIINLRKENHAFYSRRGYLETGTEPFTPQLNPKLSCHFVNMSKPLG
jgi:predicted N-acetyltransferase YhbS